jgi:hypothetical protein
MELWLPSQLSQEMIDLAQELNDKYPNLSLAWIPPENRGEGDDRPFAIVQIDRDGNQLAIIHRMSQFEVHGAYIFNWLWANDSQRVDVYDQYLKQLEAEQARREQQNTEKINQMAEVVHSVAKSPLHTYRINGRKIGTDNYEPRIGREVDAG